MSGEMINFTNLADVMKFAHMVSESKFCPKDFIGRPNDVLIAIQMGQELGLKPMQGLQNISVINGRPAVWGDAMLAICEASGEMEDHVEYFDNELQAGVCKIKRKGRTEHVEIFSIEQARLANLLEKPGPWRQYRPRMCILRARGFALRKEFSHVLKGFISVEEAQDIPIPENLKNKEILGEKGIPPNPHILNDLPSLSESTLTDLIVICGGWDEYGDRMRVYLEKKNLKNMSDLSEQEGQKILKEMLKDEKARNLLAQQEKQ